MSYQKNGLIQVTDYNSLLGPANSTAANTINAIWGDGSGSYGLGQLPLSQIATTGVNKVLPAQWNSLINTMNALKNHQGSTIVPISLNAQGDLIVASMTTGTTPQSQFVANMTTINNNRLNTAAQGATLSASTTRGTTWTNALTFTHTITFANGDAARWFFNAGGQIAITFSHPAGNFVNDMWNKLATACGTLYISSTTGSPIYVGGTPFMGVQKVGGSGTPVAIAQSQNKGYYGLTTTNQEIFKQLASTGPSGYLSSFISVSARTNGTQTTRADNGNIITITTVWDEIPNGGGTVKGTSSANSNTTATIRFPSTTYLSPSWSQPGIIGSVSGS